jgi:hypothetical protein
LKAASPFADPVIPEFATGGYPWFDKLTTLSKVEGESRKPTMASFGIRFPAFGWTSSGSRLASADG